MELVHKIITNKELPYLSLDEILVLQHISHKKYRRWLKKQSEPLPAVTPGLAEEVSEEFKGSRTDVAKLFNLTYLEVNQCLYRTKATNLRQVKRDKAQLLRSQGYTELDIHNLSLPMDLEVLSAEITAKRAAGTSLAVLSLQYGMLKSRVSQLDKGSKTKKRLTKEQKQEIKGSTQPAQALAKKYGCTVNTIYVTQREK